MSVKHAAYLVKGHSYVVYELDDEMREVNRSVVQRHEIPVAVAKKCDRYAPFSFREVMIPEAGTADNRPCTCHPDDNPPTPCAKRFAYSECAAISKATA